MDALTNLMTRRACHAFKSDPVSDFDIDRILAAGTFAPSGMGMQSPIILAVTDPELRTRMSRTNAEIMGTASDPFYNAPVILVVLADKSVPTYIYDGSVVLENMMLAAHALGLGSCWIHRAKETFERPEWKEFLKEHGIEGEYEGIGNCAIGYPAVPPAAPRPRKDHYIYRF